MEYTKNKKYKKPDLLDKVSVQQYNENFDDMDTNMAELEEKANTAVTQAANALAQVEAVGGKVMTDSVLGVGKVDNDTIGVTEDGTLSVIANASKIAATDTLKLLGDSSSPTTQALIDAVANKVVNELVTNATLTSTLASYMTKSLMSSVNADNANMVPTLALTNAMQQSIDVLNTKTIKFDEYSSQPDWNALLSSTNTDIPVRMYTVDNATKAVGAPKGCYGYGLLISITATKNKGGIWRNVLIYIEDGDKFYIRTGHTNSKWKCFEKTSLVDVYTQETS